MYIEIDRGAFVGNPIKYINCGYFIYPQIFKIKLIL